MKTYATIAGWMGLLALMLVGLGACHEEGRIGAVPADPTFEADIVEELPEDIGVDAGEPSADGEVAQVSETFGQPCEGPEECSSALCFEYKLEDDEQGFCTQACDGRCAVDGYVCFLGYCVAETYCEGEDGGGLGPGCKGSPCQGCAADEECVAGVERGVFHCVAH